MRQICWITLSLVVISVLIFGHACLGEFINLDDPLYVTANPHVLSGLTGDSLLWAFTSSSQRAGYWVPLTWLSLQADASLFGATGAWGFHLTNVLLHAANAALFFLILRQMTADLWRSAFVAALFAIHPLRVESVAWVTERKDMLSTLFLLMTIYAYIHYVRRPSLSRYATTLFCYVLGLMSKPTLVTLPIALLLLDYWPLYRLQWGQAVPRPFQARSAMRLSWLIAEKVPMLLLSVLIGVTTMIFASELGAVATMQRVPWFQRPILVLSGYLSYLEKSFWPANLAVLYPLEILTLRDAIWWFWHAVRGLVVLALISAAAIYFRRAQPYLLVGWLWFLLTLLPVSGIVQVGPQAFADRYTYVPHLGLMIAVVWGVSQLGIWQRLSLSAKKLAVAGILFGLASLAWMQTWFWRDSATLFQHTLSVTHNNYMIHYALADHYHRHGLLDEAATEYEKACRITSESTIERSYATLLIQTGAYKEAIAYLQRSLKSDPGSPDSHYFYALAVSNLGRWAEARQHLDEALKFWNRTARPEVLELHANRAGAHQLQGTLLLRDGELQKAAKQFSISLEILPTEPLSHEWLGITLCRLGQWGTAEHEFRRALELNPELDSSRGYLAYSLNQQGQTKQAADQYAILLEPASDWLPQTSTRALELVTRRRSLDPATAAELAEQVCQATEHKQAEYLDTLAATQAARGDYKTARATASRALSLTNDPALRRQLQDRLQLYEQNRPLPITEDVE